MVTAPSNDAHRGFRLHRPLIALSANIFGDAAGYDVGADDAPCQRVVARIGHHGARWCSIPPRCSRPPVPTIVSSPSSAPDGVVAAVARQRVVEIAAENIFDADVLVSRGPADWQRAITPSRLLASTQNIRIYNEIMVGVSISRYKYSLADI